MNNPIIAQTDTPTQDTIPAWAFAEPTDADLACWEPAPPPVPADPRITRLVKALQAGVRITVAWGNRYQVASGSTPGASYTVTCWSDTDGNRHTTCTCEHGQRWGGVTRYNRGTQQAHTIGRVCRHMALVHFARLSEPSREALLSQYPDLAAALSSAPILAGKAA